MGGHKTKSASSACSRNSISGEPLEWYVEMAEGLLAAHGGKPLNAVSSFEYIIAEHETDAPIPSNAMHECYNN